MSRFPAEWLALRERFDAAARNPSVIDAVTLSLAARPSVRVLDLACGAGSTVRTLHSRLPVRQHWDLVDNDPDLLALARNAIREDEITLNTVRLDLNRDLETVLDNRVDLITISALLDLVSQAWLDRFLGEVGTRALPVYAALTYDGRTDLSPADPLDALMIAGVNAHQHTDKGFGHALGPSAADATIAGFKRLGYSVMSGDSDWVIGPDDHAVQIELLNGWAAAAREMGTLSKTDIDDWLARRGLMVTGGRSSMRVGHVDVFAFPSSTR
jgi:SAM-dependent methyltransferase